MRRLRRMRSLIPRRLLPAVEQKIAERRQPARHGFAPRPHDADLRGRGFPFWQHVYQPPVAQFLVNIPGLAQQDTQPGQAPRMYHVAVVAAQRTADRDRLLPVALAQRPGVRRIDGADISTTPKMKAQPTGCAFALMGDLRQGRAMMTLRLCPLPGMLR